MAILWLLRAHIASGNTPDVADLMVEHAVPRLLDILIESNVIVDKELYIAQISSEGDSASPIISPPTLKLEVKHLDAIKSGESIIYREREGGGFHCFH